MPKLSTIRMPKLSTIRMPKLSTIRIIPKPSIINDGEFGYDPNDGGFGYDPKLPIGVMTINNTMSIKNIYPKPLR
jgi:hypothetical protein